NIPTLFAKPEPDPKLKAFCEEFLKKCGMATENEEAGKVVSRTGCSEEYKQGAASELLRATNSKKVPAAEAAPHFCVAGDNSGRFGCGKNYLDAFSQGLNSAGSPFAAGGSVIPR